MAGVSGQLTTFNGVNYEGQLYAISPEDTPFLSAIGGLNGGVAADAALFGWSTYDLPDADESAQALEGANAPTASERVRGNGFNVLEIHHEAIEISYSKLSFNRQFAGTGSSHTGQSSFGGSNAVLDEEAWQIEVKLKKIARDVDKSFIQGTFNNPATNASARRTRGILEAITTNVTDAGNAPLTEDMVLDAMQEAWENGGWSVSEGRTVMCNAGQKRKLTEIFVTNKNYQEMSRNVGGVNLTTFETDFGRCSIMLERYMPTDALAFVSIDECRPRYADVPGKGFLFVEDLARVGSAIKKQIYGEIGLEYGLELHHAKITNLNTTGS